MPFSPGSRTRRLISCPDCGSVGLPAENDAGEIVCMWCGALRPEVKEHQREYAQRPEVKERQREYYIRRRDAAQKEGGS